MASYEVDWPISMRAVGHIPDSIAISVALLSPILAEIVVIRCDDYAPTAKANGKPSSKRHKTSFLTNHFQTAQFSIFLDTQGRRAKYVFVFMDKLRLDSPAPHR
jgi:hypothetical protein